MAEGWPIPQSQGRRERANGAEMGARVHEAIEMRVGIVGCGRMGCAIAGASLSQPACPPVAFLGSRALRACLRV